MNLKKQRLMSNSRISAVALAAILWLGCFYGLGAAGVFDLDEGLYTTVSRQMLDSSDWLIPKIGSQVFFDKPPLLYWMQAISIRVFGATSFAVRLPSALAAMFTALALYWWARKRGARNIGWLAAGIFALSPLTIALARQAITDSLLTLWFTLAVIGWIEGNRGKRWGYILMAAACGLATMTKGTIGVLLPGAAFFIRMIIMRDFKELKRVPWIPAVGLYLLIVLPWHLALFITSGSEFINEYIVHQQMARFLGKDFAHNQPVWFYIPILLIGGFPWSAVVPVAWLNSIRSRNTDAEPNGEEWMLWALWAGVVVGFFSISKSKLPGYVQPAIPALSILAARRLAGTPTKALARLECALVGIGGALFGGLLTVAGTLGRLWQSQTDIMLNGRPVPPAVADALSAVYLFTLPSGIIFLFGTAIIILRRKAVQHVVVTGIITGVAFAVIAGGVGLSAWSKYNIDPLHSLARITIPALEKGEKLIIYGFERRRPSLLFITGHTENVIEIDDTAKPNEPEALRREVVRSKSGYILAGADTEFPVLPGRLYKESKTGKWTLWRFSKQE